VSFVLFLSLQNSMLVVEAARSEYRII
jgi:hypothetical protein